MKNKIKLFYTVSELKKLPPLDQHIHTKQTDGQNSIEEIIKISKQKNFFRIAFTEHVQRRSHWYKNFSIKVLRQAKKNVGRLEIILGLEAKQINNQGEIDCTKEQRSHAQIIMGSVHGYLKKDECDFYEFNQLDSKVALKKELSQVFCLIRNVKKNSINVIGHPFGVYIKNYRKPVPYEYWRKVIKEITKRKIAFDLNYKYHKKYFSVILYLAEKYGTRLNLGSDVHDLKELGGAYKEIKKLL